MVQYSKLKKTSPLISVLMPAYNAEKFIAEAIESILTQTLTNFEFIILDDFSTDDTWKIIQKYARKDSRITAKRNTKNIYIAAARNELIKKAKAKYIAWQDADDISIRARMEKQYKYLENHPQVGIVGGYLQFFNEVGNTTIRKYARDDKSLRKNIFRFSPVAQPASMIRRSCFEELGNYNISYPPAEDIDMSFRIGTKYKFANLPEIVLKYRQSPKSATYQKVKFILSTTLKIRKKYWNSYAYSPTLTDKLHNIIQWCILYILPSNAIIFLFNFIRNK